MSSFCGAFVVLFYYTYISMKGEYFYLINFSAKMQLTIVFVNFLERTVGKRFLPLKKIRQWGFYNGFEAADRKAAGLQHIQSRQFY